MGYELIHKPTFTSQLLALPSTEIPRIVEKVELLRESPEPDAKNKKRLKGYKQPVYRIRSGHYRVLYTFGQDASANGWVALLGVDHRKDVYDSGELVADGPGVDLGDVSGDRIEESADNESSHWSEQPSRPPIENATTGDDLPVRFDNDLLSRLRIPEQHHDAIVACRTLDDLMAADIPEATRERLFDVAYTPDYASVLDQPSYQTGEPDDLLRYVEGELLDFLLKLDPEQERYVTWAVSGAGPTLVKGSPGTGKSTVALYRAKSLIEALRQDGTDQPRILFTTYTNALVSSSRQLLERLLGDDAPLVDVRTADSVVRQIVSDAGVKFTIASGDELAILLRQAITSASREAPPEERRALQLLTDRVSNDYLLEELEGVIVARGLSSLGEYLAATRAGRKVGLSRLQRAAFWRVHDHLELELERRDLTSWSRLRQLALSLTEDDDSIEHYDGVIIDESQDLDPTVLRLMVTLCRTPDRLFVTADANQSLYGAGFRWTDVHQDLRFTGRTGILRRNHRSTEEIGTATNSYLRQAVLDQTDPAPITYIASGPIPTVRHVTSTAEEIDILTRFISAATRDLRLGPGACAVLVPSERTGREIARQLGEHGIDADFMPGRELDLERPCVKVITQQSAKGLEFPIVAVAGFGNWPRTHAVSDEQQAAEAERRERQQRTIYVAMTRAMRALLVLVPADHPSPLFDGFDSSLWNTGSPVSRAG